MRREPAAPLLRYRTGDHAALAWRDGSPVLVGLEGRAPVRFRAASGRWVESIEVTQVLSALGLPAYTVDQDASGAITVSIPEDAPAALVASAAASLLGPVTVVAADLRGATKPQRYTSQMIR
ncbi:hypothetical protein ACFQV2_24385 [Actinokineospora soli]|uniref:Uncharacterized protein n=1 Tax=Actinokineospora soli TaxID=1048753 RepID=A0ABW2TT94_9PSEU